MKDKPSRRSLYDFIHDLDLSAILTVIGIILLFSTAIGVVLIAPRYVDPSWTTPTSSYQVQMYEVSDPNFYISNTVAGQYDLQFVHHLKNDASLLAFQESDQLKIQAPDELKKYITRAEDKELKLTSRLLLLRVPSDITSANEFKGGLQEKWEKDNPEWKEHDLAKPNFEILELYAPEEKEAFSVGTTDGVIENWVDNQFRIIDEAPKQEWHRDSGVIYIKNPREYRVIFFQYGNEKGWKYDPRGQPVKTLETLTSAPLAFHSREELIKMGEHLYAIEGCWYCHTDQTRTLVQDVVLNGSDTYPAPPSAANEYIYQQITFPGTRRIGPDLSRTGVKRPSRDWHKSHFWSPKTESQGSIMPSFRHFFDNDPRGTSRMPYGIPNLNFEAIYQYLMTKGTRITPPTQAWWLGKDPVKTKEIIEGMRTLPP